MPRWGNPNITLIMSKCGRVLVAQRWRSSRDGDPVPPFPGVAAPGAWLGDPLPPAQSEMCLINPFSSEGCVSLSLQTRRGFARSSQSALGEFRSFVPRTLFALSYTSSLRSSLSPRLARYARHRYAVFFLAELS